MKKSIRVSQGLIYWTRVATLGVVIGVGLQFASAWTNPTAAPPLGNVSGPVTTSAIAQYKAGAIGFGGLVKAYLGIDANNNRIVNVATPVDGKDAVNKDYIDANAGGGPGSTAGWCSEDIFVSSNGTKITCNATFIAPSLCDQNRCGCASGYTLVTTGMNATQSTGSGNVVSNHTKAWYTCAKQ
jgi:hypothetical protein